MGFVAIVSLLVSGLFQAGGEYFSKMWGYHPSISLTAMTILLYALSGLVWLPALLYRNQLSTIGVAWDIIAISVTLILGIFVFHEQLSPSQWIGIALGVLALYLLLR